MLACIRRPWHVGIAAVWRKAIYSLVPKRPQHLSLAVYANFVL